MTHLRQNINGLFHRDKNSKLAYYATAYSQIAMPHAVLRQLLACDMKALAKRKDQTYIHERVSYYNRLTNLTPIDHQAFSRQATPIGRQPVVRPKVYYLDSYRYAKAFDLALKWLLLPGDITNVPTLPSITKSRPIGGDNANSVLMKLDRVRHFLFVNDSKRFEEKKDMVIFRGEIGQKEGDCIKQNRYDFIQKYFGHPMVDAGVVDARFKEWHKPKISLRKHLDYKFVMALEGNDVATNLKWIMSSNSIAVMPRPTCETWFMEGKLIPNYHYIEVKADFSDLTEQLNHYIAHPDEAQRIIEHAHEFVAQFKDGRRERIISLLVLQKYLDITNKPL